MREKRLRLEGKFPDKRKKSPQGKKRLRYETNISYPEIKRLRTASDER
jgi:hypothetical protein